MHPNAEKLCTPLIQDHRHRKWLSLIRCISSTREDDVITIVFQDRGWRFPEKLTLGALGERIESSAESIESSLIMFREVFDFSKTKSVVSGFIR